MVVPPFHTPKWSFLVGKPMVVGYHHFRRPPYTYLYLRLNPIVPKFSSTAFGAPRKPWGKCRHQIWGKSPLWIVGPLGFECSAIGYEGNIQAWCSNCSIYHMIFNKSVFVRSDKLIKPVVVAVWAGKWYVYTTLYNMQSATSIKIYHQSVSDTRGKPENTQHDKWQEKNNG